MDMNQKAKTTVLQKLIDMMDEKMTGDLKEKSPKFAKVDIQSDDPELATTLKNKLMDSVQEEEPSLNKFPETESPADEKEEEPDDMERLLEMYKQLK